MKQEITYKSQDGLTDIHAIIWKPTTPVVAILQLSHGMVEHISRYESTALELNKHGILVCGNDHLGHGNSITEVKNYGYFCQKNQDTVLVNDLHKLTKIIKNDYPNVPNFLLGHSMGSFIVRNYIEKYSEDINGTIIVGSGYKSGIVTSFAKFATWITQFYHHGWYYRSPFLYKQTNGGFSKRFEEGKDNPFCWLTTNQVVIDDYKNDPLSKFRFTCNAYYGLFTLIKKSCQKKLCKKIRKDLPILILSGKDDPVGDFGKGIYKIEKLYKSVGLKDVKIKLYNGMRHEILNEENRILVLNDIINFIKEKYK